MIGNRAHRVSRVPVEDSGNCFASCASGGEAALKAMISGCWGKWVYFLMVSGFNTWVPISSSFSQREGTCMCLAPLIFV